MRQRTFMYLFCLLAIFCSADSIAQNVDIDILKSINPDVPNSPVWRGFSSSVAPVVIALPFGMYLVNYLEKNEYGKESAWHIAGAIGTSLVLTQGLKLIFNRDRPFVKYPADVHPFDPTDVSLSFPSQHTSFAFATATALSMRYRKWWVVVPAYTWASMVGYSRLYLGAHYPSDVIAGAALGTGSAILSERLIRKINRTGKISKALRFN